MPAQTEGSSGAGTEILGSGYRVAVARYLTTGRKVALDVLAGDDLATGVAAASNAIVIGGTTVGGSHGFLVGRLLPDGTPDTTFSGDGLEKTTAASGGGNALAIVSGGKIVLAGSAAKIAGRTDPAFVRYAP